MRLRMYTSLVEDLRECMEFALELRGFLRDDVLSIYPTVLDDFYITLIQSGGHILNNYSTFRSVASLRRSLKKSCVTTITGTR